MFGHVTPGSRPSQDCPAFSGDRWTGFTDLSRVRSLCVIQLVGRSVSTVLTGLIDWNDGTAIWAGFQSETAYFRDRTLLFCHDGDK